MSERIGQIELGWSLSRFRAPERACADARMRIGLLQRALRKRLLATHRPSLCLNRRCPLGAGVDFSELDAMAEALWAATADTVQA